MISSAALLLSGVCSCTLDEAPETLKSVDLRYRVEDVYNLAARNAQPFSIVVTSTDPWTVTSQHPDWCIITEEEGAASDPAKVLVGNGDKTNIQVQYYDNLELDDREDIIEIRSDYWLGKTVKVIQKGIAYLYVPEEQMNISIPKTEGTYEIPVEANQDWTAKVTEGSFLEITDGASGSLDGTIKFHVRENPQEQRYAVISIYDRHGVEQVQVNITQNGVQLDPSTFEIRCAYDQTSVSFDVVSNGVWTVARDNEADDWYTITNPDNEGSATVNITLKPNAGTGLKVGHIIVKSVSSNPDDFVAQKVITIKQAYYIAPVRHILDNEEMSLWKSDQAKTPVYNKGVGTYFENYARLNRNPMPFGNYTFSWTSIDPASRIRHWFCYSDGQEIKYNLKAASKSVVVDFNASSAGVSGKPEGITDSKSIDINGTHTFTIKFEPSGDNYCRVIYLVDGEEMTRFESSDSVMHKVTWGADINMYVGVDTGGSAVCEWYEYTAPVNWEE